MSSRQALGQIPGPSRVATTTRAGQRAPCRWNTRYTRYPPPRASSEGAESASGAETSHQDQAEQRTRDLVIKPRPPRRRPGEPPKPVEIERTSSFLIRKSEQERREKYSGSLIKEETRRHRSLVEDLDFNENPVGWVLRKTDESLDAMESNIPDDAKEAITYVTGNLGTKASKVAVDAAKLAAKGGAKIAKAAVPAGTWVLSKGFGALVSVASSAAKAKAKQQRKNRGD